MACCPIKCGRPGFGYSPYKNELDAETVKAPQPPGVHFDFFEGERKIKNALDFHPG